MLVYCNNCEKDVKLKNDKCPNCGLKIDKEVIEYKKNEYEEEIFPKNTVSQILKIIGWIIVISGLIIGLIYAFILDGQIGLIPFLEYVFAFFASSMLFFALGEIIQLLEDIKNKIK